MGKITTKDNNKRIGLCFENSENVVLIIGLIYFIMSVYLMKIYTIKYGETILLCSYCFLHPNTTRDPMGLNGHLNQWVSFLDMQVFNYKL